MTIKKYFFIGILFFILSFVYYPFLNPSFAQIERFLPRQGGTTELWRITNDPSIRNWVNYHNTDAWSPDGRYICYVKYEPYELVPNSWHYLVYDTKKEIYIYDLYEDKEIKIGIGTNPRWATNHNWLFYICYFPEDGPPDGKGTQLMWLNVDTNELTRIAYGVTNLGETDFDDCWIYGFRWRIPKEVRERQSLDDIIGLRIPIRPDSRAEIIEGLKGIFWIPNPQDPSIMIRKDTSGPQGDLPFAPTRTYCDLEGKNITNASPMIQRCHQGWSGDGAYLMHGGSPISGRRWDEPFPSNLHILAVIGCGDVSSSGKSGRWISGSSNRGPLQIVDLRSGDGRNYFKTALSYIHDSNKFPYSFGSAVHDNDAKGSADGTKIIFASNYDLKDGPVTEVSENVSVTAGGGGKIPVKSTAGFPDKGRLTVQNEIIGYTHKTPASFEGLTRGLHNTVPIGMESLWRMTPEQRELLSKRPFNLSKGLIISSFDARLIPEDKRRKMPKLSNITNERFRPDITSPLIWQNRTNVYIAVVRLPDQPHLWKIDDEVELIPGENHWETYGYHIYKGGKKITGQPLRPGTYFTLPELGTYTAVAVEWSGLESRHSFSFQTNGAEKLRIRFDKPADFSWTSERWLVNDKEVSEEDAVRSEEAVKEIVHLVEGVIHREWYNWGQIIKRYDLNYEGKPIRRLFYKNGKLARREYHNSDGIHVSTEFFDPDGYYITESIQYRIVDGKSQENGHFRYENGMPVKFIGRGGRHAAPQGYGIYVKEGDPWVKKD